MRASHFVPGLLAVGLLITAGCAGPERKLGRGITNITEPIRMGEVRRSMEQAALWGNYDSAYTTGFFHGLNKEIARTAVGVFEIVTFPIPSYEPIIHPENPVYPDNYKPAVFGDSTFETDTALGFSGGDVLPWAPGSRFRVFDR